jgi:lipid-A-disaccharide synthase
VERYLPEKTATLFISTGELSGEMHASHLVRALQRLRQERGLPPAIVEGNGSRRLKEEGASLLFDVATWSEMGIVANLLKAQFFHRVVTATARYILSNQPDMVVLVDNRVLNTNLARMLRKAGYGGRIVYYVAPVRWESLYSRDEHQRSLRNSRFLDIKRYCDFAFLIYPVSLRVYEELDIPHLYIGHPLCELAQTRLTDDEFYRMVGLGYTDSEKPLIIGALPGSRRGELRCIAPPVFRAARLVQEAFEEAPDLPEIHVVSSIPHPELGGQIMEAARHAGLEKLTLIEPRYNYDLMARARVMLVKSGTGLHECVLMNVPAVMCYRVPRSLAWIAKYLMRFSMPYYGLPNLLLNQPVVPEMVQEDCIHTRIAEVAGSLLFEEGERRVMLDKYAEVRELLCRPQPLRTAAERIQELLPR